MKPDFNLKGGENVYATGFMSDTFRDMAMLDAHLYLALCHIKNDNRPKAISEIMFAREIIGFPSFTSHLSNDPKEIEEILCRFNEPEVE